MAVSCLRVTKPDQIDLIFQLILADCVFWDLGQKYPGSLFDFEGVLQMSLSLSLPLSLYLSLSLSFCLSGHVSSSL